MKVDKKYTHFAISKKLNKVCDGWDYKKTDKDDIKYWSDIDLENNFPDVKPSAFKVLTKEAVLKLGIDPMEWNNWIKPNDFVNL